MDDPTAEKAPVRVGEILAGKYKVEHVLGSGGMGVVVAARHIQLDQLVALKFLRGAGITNPKIVARFEREARAVVKLKSAHVARVSDVGTLDDGAPYIVMEFLEGLDLGQVIDTRGALPVDEAVDYVLQTCEALAEAHGNGIVHRDLKPQNLFLTIGVDGRQLVKVLDFGISKLEGGMENLSLTHTSEVIGSPNYMSPEQLRAARLADARSDIWSLGVILFELLTAQMPFEAETLPHLSALIISDPPRHPTGIRPDIPLSLESIVLRCLEKDPSKRFASVVDLAAALEPFAHGRTTGAADRVRAVASARSGSGPTSGPALSALSGENPVVRGSMPVGRGSSQNTSIGWGQTELAQKTKKSPAPVILAVGSAFLVVAIGVGWYLHASAPTLPSTNATSGADAAVATVKVPDLLPTTSASPPPSAIPSSPTTAVATATAKPPKPNGSNRPGHPIVKPKPGEFDDLPSERN